MSAWTVPSYAEGWAVPGYSEQRELGRGTSGRVVEAVSDATGQRVAIKYLSPALVRDQGFMWGFRSEAQMLRSLGVPHVVQVYDYVEQPGHGAAIVMELVSGVSLHEMIVRRGPTGPEAALAVLKGSLLGLAAAHTLGIVHRDYKPENVLVETGGNSKLADFGVAVRAGKQTPAAGTPLYMAPEQWHGAPPSPAADVYAATAVFFECLTGRTPFTGKITQLREQHVAAPVPLERVDVPLQGLIARGMAKNPADRPRSAIAFVAELEAAASAAYGPDWEERGRGHLAVRAAALLPLLLSGARAGSSGSSSGSTWLGGRGRHGRGGRGGSKRKVLTVAAIAAASVVVLGSVATAVALNGKGNSGSMNGSSQQTTVTPSVTAVADVTPPVAASKCATMTSFTYSGTLTAMAPSTVKYQWVYSSGKPGPVETVSFTGSGHKTVTGDTVKTETAGGGWGEIKMVSPVAQTSNKASYKLLCNGSGQISASASIQVPSGKVTCGTTPPNLTATGSITNAKAGTVTYYWAQSDGQNSAPATLTFAAPGTLAVPPLTVTPPGDPGSGDAVLVVTSPAGAASSPATYTLSCKTPVTPLSLSATVAVSPASQTLTSCTAAAPTFKFSGTISDNKAGQVGYYWKLPSGNGATRTLNFAKAGSQTVTTTYTPSSDSVSGSGSLVITSPASVTSNAAPFTVACGQALAIANNAPVTATVGQAYSGTVTVTGGNGTYTWGAVTGLPAGLTSSASAGTLTISGTPTAVATSTVTVTASDTESTPKTASTSITITVSPAPLIITTGSLPAGTLRTAYSATVAATGGTGTVTWAATGLPTGLTINSLTGTISGTPAATGSFPVTVTATAGTSTPASYTLVINPGTVVTSPTATTVILQ